ncbi:MAG: response regulator transcription factor [Clostridia bacterium]|nr:response regulator transcription factor [Clostridia bacterium]
MKILLAEDELELSDALVDILQYHKYIVDAVHNGTDAFDYARTGDYDGIIMDIMMPGMDGLTVLDRLRAEGLRTPVLLLTAKSQVEDRIRGLDMGADDYLTKPFDTGELLARIRAMLRRKADYTPDQLTAGDLCLDRQSALLRGPEGSLPLSRLEFRMLELFMLNRGICVPSETILEKVWGYDTDAELGAVWVYISYLRKKLQQVGSTAAIRAKRGVGYILEVEQA